MSDHEDGGLDDWEEGTLPDTPAISTSYANSESLLKPSHHVPYNQRQPLHDKENTRILKNLRRGDSTRDERYSRRLPTEPTDGIPGRSTGVESRHVRPNLPQTNPAREKKRNNDPPTRTYVLSVTWHTFLTNINSDNIPPARLARLRLDEIAASTESYIDTPSDFQSTEIRIWGSIDQATAAFDLLRIWEREVRETGRRPHRNNWIKQTALDGRMEERAARQVTHKIVKTQWKAFEESLDHSFELCLLWPQSIGLEDFQEEHAQTIQDLEEAYDCRILCNRIQSMVQVFAHEEVRILQVQDRLINIGREMIAKRNEVIRATFLRYPKSSTFKSGVQLIKDDRSNNFLPSLCGSSLPQDDVEHYQTFAKSSNHKTRLKIRRHIEKGLTGHLQLSSKHVRMRITFLELAFLQYKRPSGDKPHHEFSEYVDMIGDERTTIQAQGLRNNGKDLSQLADKLTEHLGQPETAFAVHFDFDMGGMGKGTTLRFEYDLRPSFMKGEVETMGQRWLEHRSEAEDDLLLINVLDFERPGYQIAVRAVPFPHNRAIQGEMDLFTRSVEFTTPSEGIKAPPKRRAKFPPGRQMLKQVSEMIILKYKFKNQGVFELRRRDSYLANSDSKAIKTDWSACYYYQDWDNLMGKFGDLKPGQDVDFNRSVATFFPVENHEKLEAGLKRFTNEIEELQTLLGVCINKLPIVEVNEPSQQSTPPPEVNGHSPDIDKSKDNADRGRWNDLDPASLDGGRAHVDKGKGKAFDTSANTANKRPGPRKPPYEVLHRV